MIEKIVNEIRMKMFKKHISILELSKRSNVSKATISRFLNEKNSMSLSNMIKICDVLDMYIVLKDNSEEVEEYEL